MTSIETFDIECAEAQISSAVYAQTLAGEKLLASINRQVNGMASPELVEAAMAALVAAAIKTRDARRKHRELKRLAKAAV